MENRISEGGSPKMYAVEDALAMESHFLEQEVFHNLLLLERRRTERSRNPFVLMLLRLQGIKHKKSAGGLVREICEVLMRCTRDSDLKGWYEEPSIVGVMFCESCGCDGRDLESLLFCRLREELRPYFRSTDEMDASLSFHFFPEEHGAPSVFSEPDAHLYPELAQNRGMSRLESGLKRSIDLIGSLVLLVGLFPFFALIAAIIKATSEGPVFFRQERVGQFGKKFILLKFRTMINRCDTSAHQDYMRDFITGKIGEECRPAEQDVPDDGKPVFKITNDSRVTAIGKILRKTSLDELPQCFNVLMGEMSLVGPRPPIPYEVEIYDIWHRRRILEMKPGITGLWQVAGRSATTFDESVRLDLRYTKEWSLWLDLKILLLTPIVAITGKGGY